MQMRPYQQAAREAVHREWDEGRKRTLLVLPTGCGKTIVFAKITEDEVRSGNRVLILAHRGELLQQAADKLERTSGLKCAVEKAEQTCLGEWYRVTVGSVQTLMRQKRLAQFPPNYFQTIIIDEAHHAISDSYQSILEHFPDANVLGVTATPDRVAYRALRQASKISMLITAIGVSFFLENLFNVLFGGSSRFFSAPEFFNNTRAFGDVIITNVAWIVPLITVLLLLAILWLLYRTRYGMAIRAVAFDVNTVRLMGIDANRIISLVFALGSSLAALGGVFYSISYPTIDPLMGVLIGLKAFAAAVLGGIGSVTGVVLGGFILGFTEVVAVALFPELGGYKDAFAFMFLILVLLFRPVGIMGDERLERSRF